MAHYIDVVLNPCRVQVYQTRMSNVFVHVTFSERGRLSITGVIGPKKSGNAAGGCGQIADVLIERGLKLNAGWTPAMMDQLRTVWARWHLNDMHPGTPRQMAFLDGILGCMSFADSCAVLREAGLYEDDGHKYGSQWLYESVPDDVLEFLMSLPVTKVTPAWV